MTLQALVSNSLIMLGTQLVRVIGMFTHLQGRGAEPVALKHSAFGSIVIFVGLCQLLVQLIVYRFHRTLNRMPETGGWFCFGFLKL